MTSVASASQMAGMGCQLCTVSSDQLRTHFQRENTLTLKYPYESLEITGVKARYWEYLQHELAAKQLKEKEQVQLVGNITAQMINRAILPLGKTVIGLENVDSLSISCEDSTLKIPRQHGYVLQITVDQRELLAEIEDLYDLFTKTTQANLKIRPNQALFLYGVKQVSSEKKDGSEFHVEGENSHSISISGKTISEGSATDFAA
jgi:hypothetical protein